MTNPRQDQEPMEPPTTAQEPEGLRRSHFTSEDDNYLTMIVVVVFAGVGSSLDHLPHHRPLDSIWAGRRKQPQTCYCHVALTVRVTLMPCIVQALFPACHLLRDTGHGLAKKRKCPAVIVYGRVQTTHQIEFKSVNHLFVVFSLGSCIALHSLP